MGKLMQRSLIALLLACSIGSVAHAAATKFTDLTVTGNLIVTGTSTHTGAVTNTAGVTTGGVITTSASTPYAIQIASTTAAVPTGTPTATGLIAVDKSNIVYISTSTNAGGWQKIGAQ